MTEKKPVIWVLADDRAGNVNQVLGVAEAMGLPFEVKDVVYDEMGKWPNILRGSSLRGVDVEESSELKSPWPDIVLGAGRKTAPVARYIKKVSQGKTKAIQIMWPGFPYRHFDMIFVPQHDGIAAGGRIVNTVGSPNRINKDVLSKKKKKWEEAFSYMQDPFVALLVGGDTKKGKFTTAHAQELANKVNLFFQDKKGSLLVTNSRRTSEDAVQVLKKEIKVKFHYHDYYSTNENPYFGYLAISDAIIASGDSISMCSEACSSGKPVFIYAPESLTPDKHRRFHQNLYEKGCARPLTGKWEKWKYEPLDDTKRVASMILENFC
ncbi:MAG: nucleoside-diphosphate sugar epimerase [Alphaproteobacteria bacterium CG11_big_fil_rev_8_21_14_0_20_39_49]|nr:MAG: nucleoside-diphosphate sugar epimerase [Alphaproteobacteria bacterium CG11_big_fil_rev_8_21_14_0_20_39_49]